MSNELSSEEIERSHRWHAVECNNLAWALSDDVDRTPAQDEEMLDAAHASAFHWSKVGTDLHRARAWMLLGRVHACLGDGKTALRYARQSYAYLAAHDPPDWELAFAHAILAQAAHAAGDGNLHREHHARAKELGDAIADPEDKEIFFKTFEGVAAP